ncbi:MAG: hypothetical protein JO199_04155 [Candidatus Eremiobacteraeota bacterium]|nr:hypothetical protein [Candidatus Eremiobacteraeota bacterium]
MPTRTTLLRAQAAYYVATGVWPLLSMASFETVTGKKRDRWLVRTVGVLVTCIGVSIGAGTRDGDAPDSTVLLAVSTALGLACVESVYVARRTISPIYAADALLELLLAGALLL